MRLSRCYKLVSYATFGKDHLWAAGFAFYLPAQVLDVYFDEVLLAASLVASHGYQEDTLRVVGVALHLLFGRHVTVLLAPHVGQQ